MFQVYLCDDSATLLESYGRTLTEIAKRNALEVGISTFLNGEALLFRYEDAAEKPDVIFLDILMGGENGVQTARELRAQGCRAELIFLTSTPDYVFDAFDVSASNYLLKDISPRRLEEVFLRACAAVEHREKDVFSCENGAVRRNIPVSSISCFEVVNRLVTVYCGGETFQFYSSLEDVEARLDNADFLRVHRSFLVHLPCVKEFSRTNLVLSSGQVVPVGVTYAKKVKETINRYFGQTL